MNKQSLILKYFQKASQLTISHKQYKENIHELFTWLLKSDEIENDISTKVLFNTPTKNINAQVIAKSKCVVAGIDEIEYLLKAFSHIKCTSVVQDGMRVAEKDIVLKLSGEASELFVFERALLNILQRMSGIATETARYVDEVHTLQMKQYPYILATRKTPLMLIDKKAVALGGGLTHRLTLSDGILIKDNHLLLLKEQYNLQEEKELVSKAVEIIFNSEQEFAEIEVEQSESLLHALDTFQSFSSKKVLAILLDNFTPERAMTVIDQAQKKYNLDHILFEASGSVKFENIKEWAKSGVDVISVGALTHSSKAADLSLELL